MASVFISYSSKDKLIASRIARDLEQNGIRVWVDTNELLPGDSLFDKITQGIRNSDYLLFILSKNSVQSEWVNKELAIAYLRN